MVLGFWEYPSIGDRSCDRMGRGYDFSARSRLEQDYFTNRIKLKIKDGIFIAKTNENMIHIMNKIHT